MSLRVFRRFVTALLVGLMVLAMPALTASAALCVKWQSPTEAVLGDEILVTFETLVPWTTDSQQYELRPHVVEDYPFDVAAVGPAGQEQTIRVTPDTPTVWSGTFSPSMEGEWTVVIRNFSTTVDTDCYTPLVVDVTASASSPLMPTAAVLASLTVIVVLAWASRRNSAGRSAKSDVG